MLGRVVSGLCKDVGPGPALRENIVVQLVLQTGCAKKGVQYAEHLKQLYSNERNTKTRFSESLLGQRLKQNS